MDFLVSIYDEIRIRIFFFLNVTMIAKRTGCQSIVSKRLFLDKIFTR